jgi:dynein heavy chain
MRDISKVFQGLLRSDPKYYDTKESMIRLWVHEVQRVFADRLITDEDKDKLVDIVNTKLNALFDSNWKKLFKESKTPCMFADFLDEDMAAPVSGNSAAAAAPAAPAAATSSSGGDEAEERAPYQEVTHKMNKVKAFMEEKLNSFNLDPDHVSQDLVLFDAAIEHVARIYRIITQPRGSALLIGVGGSGRQSLARLAAHIAGMGLFSIQPTQRYRPSDFREDLKTLYRRTGVRCEPTVFLLSDTQMVHESMLDDVNSILTSGDVAKLFPPDELGPLLEELRNDATKLGRSTASDALYSFFIERVRENLHVVLCMSPVGSAFRNRIRMFPSLCNNCTIDTYARWPTVALTDVAARFLKDVDVGGPKVKEALAQTFCSMHTAAIDSSTRMLMELKRHNYITPTKYLDLVKIYRLLLADKRARINVDADKLKNGLDKLENSSSEVQAMSVQLEEKKKVVAQKKITCDKLLVEIVQKQRAADEQKKQVELGSSNTLCNCDRRKRAFHA